MVHQERRQRHLEMLRPLNEFMQDVARATDEPGGAVDFHCAVALLRSWAAAGALLERPLELNGTVERSQMALGLNVLAVKLGDAGVPLDGMTLNWLDRLTTETIDFFERRPFGNLEVWSGANAASLLLLRPSRRASAYQDRVWHQATAHIGPDGTVPSELRRGRRAMVYHQYYLSAVLVLRSLREARGLRATADENQAIHRLGALVSESHCNAAAIGAAAGIQQDRTGPADQRIMAAFGQEVVTEQFRRCAPRAASTVVPLLGGRLDRVQQILARLAAQADAGVAPGNRR
ncbi:alginate lyase family protein [Falsiroseomonas sp. E2-1-a20]